jgi:hypothetical protein
VVGSRLPIDGWCIIFALISGIGLVLVWSSALCGKLDTFPLLLVSGGRRSQVVNVFPRRVRPSLDPVAVASSVADNANRSYPCSFKPPFHMVAYQHEIVGLKDRYRSARADVSSSIASLEAKGFFLSLVGRRFEGSIVHLPLTWHP